MKNVFGGFITRPDMAQERISELQELEDIYFYVWKPKSKEKKDWKKKKKGWLSKDYETGDYKRCNTIMGIPEGKERKKGKEEIFETIMIETFPQINVTH